MCQLQVRDAREQEKQGGAMPKSLDNVHAIARVSTVARIVGAGYDQGVGA